MFWNSDVAMWEKHMVMPTKSISEMKLLMKKNIIY